MTQNTAQNLNAHYTSNSKVQKPKRMVTKGPANVPENYTFNDDIANLKIKIMNEDIYKKTKAEKSKADKNIFKIFIGIILSGLAIFGGYRLFK